MNETCFQCFGATLDEHGICSVCGYDNRKNKEAYPLALPAGSILYGRYVIGKVLGQGGFGITYLAQDYQTKELVAIKEFFPYTMVSRTSSMAVSPLSGENGENFAYGRTSFLDEAKTMAEFNDNPNVAGVKLYFEENGTAYFVMEYVDGCSFQEFIRNRGGRISWEETMEILVPVMNALSAIHEKGIIHRDVTPDNIFITKSGTVKLLDFGAARHSLGNVTRSLDVILKHGFAPMEQYSRRGRQGPYTDVYSVSATIYYAITGARPDDAIERMDNDSLPYPSIIGAKITPAQENILLKGLELKAEDRYQTVAELRNALTAAGALETEPVPNVPHTTALDVDHTVLIPVVDQEDPKDDLSAKEKKNKKAMLLVTIAAVFLLALAAFWFFHPHSYGEWITTKDATCTEDGTMTRKCFCGNTETMSVPKLGHQEEEDPPVAATCVEPGLTRGTHCIVCGAVVKAQETLEPTGHNIVTLAAVDPTCTENGLTEGFGCDRCDYAETPQEMIDATGHTVIIDKAVEATCKSEGLTEGSHCEVCEAVLVEQTVIAIKTEHIYVQGYCSCCGKKDPNVVWVSCSSCGGSGGCSACGGSGWCGACGGMGAWYEIDSWGNSTLVICSSCNNSWYCGGCGGSRACSSCGGNGGHYA